MAALHVNQEVTDIRAGWNAGIDAVVVWLGYEAAMHLTVDEAFKLVDELREAMRQAATTQARTLHRDEDAVRASADIREGL